MASVSLISVLIDHQFEEDYLIHPQSFTELEDQLIQKQQNKQLDQTQGALLTSLNGLWLGRKEDLSLTQIRLLNTAVPYFLSPGFEETLFNRLKQAEISLAVIEQCTFLSEKIKKDLRSYHAFKVTKKLLSFNHHPTEWMETALGMLTEISERPGRAFFKFLKIERESSESPEDVPIGLTFKTLLRKKIQQADQKIRDRQVTFFYERMFDWINQVYSSPSLIRLPWDFAQLRNLVIFLYQYASFPLPEVNIPENWASLSFSFKTLPEASQRWAVYFLKVKASLIFDFKRKFVEKDLSTYCSYYHRELFEVYGVQPSPKEKKNLLIALIFSSLFGETSKQQVRTVDPEGFLACLKSLEILVLYRGSEFPELIVDLPKHIFGALDHQIFSHSEEFSVQLVNYMAEFILLMPDSLGKRNLFSGWTAFLPRLPLASGLECLNRVLRHPKTDLITVEAILYGTPAPIHWLKNYQNIQKPSSTTLPKEDPISKKIELSEYRLAVIRACLGKLREFFHLECEFFEKSVLDLWKRTNGVRFSKGVLSPELRVDVEALSLSLIELQIHAGNVQRFKEKTESLAIFRDMNVESLKRQLRDSVFEQKNLDVMSLCYPLAVGFLGSDPSLEEPGNLKDVFQLVRFMLADIQSISKEGRGRLLGEVGREQDGTEVRRYPDFYHALSQALHEGNTDVRYLLSLTFKFYVEKPNWGSLKKDSWEYLALLEWLRPALEGETSFFEKNLRIQRRLITVAFSVSLLLVFTNDPALSLIPLHERESREREDFPVASAGAYAGFEESKAQTEDDDERHLSHETAKIPIFQWWLMQCPVGSVLLLGTQLLNFYNATRDYESMKSMLSVCSYPGAITFPTEAFPPVDMDKPQSFESAPTDSKIGSLYVESFRVLLDPVTPYERALHKVYRYIHECSPQELRELRVQLYQQTFASIPEGYHDASRLLAAQLGGDLAMTWVGFFNLLGQHANIHESELYQMKFFSKELKRFRAVQMAQIGQALIQYVDSKVKTEPAEEESAPLSLSETALMNGLRVLGMLWECAPARLLSDGRISSIFQIFEPLKIRKGCRELPKEIQSPKMESYFRFQAVLFFGADSPQSMSRLLQILRQDFEGYFGNEVGAPGYSSFLRERIQKWLSEFSYRTVFIFMMVLPEEPLKWAVLSEALRGRVTEEDRTKSVFEYGGKIRLGRNQLPILACLLSLVGLYEVRSGRWLSEAGPAGREFEDVLSRTLSIEALAKAFDEYKHTSGYFHGDFNCIKDRLKQATSILAQWVDLSDYALLYSRKDKEYSWLEGSRGQVLRKFILPNETEAESLVPLKLDQRRNMTLFLKAMELYVLTLPGDHPARAETLSYNTTQAVMNKSIAPTATVWHWRDAARAGAGSSTDADIELTQVVETPSGLEITIAELSD